MISIMIAALLNIKEAGGTKSVIGQASTEFTMGDSTTLLRTESIGTHFEDITMH